MEDLPLSERYYRDIISEIFSVYYSKEDLHEVQEYFVEEGRRYLKELKNFYLFKEEYVQKILKSETFLTLFGIYKMLYEMGIAYILKKLDKNVAKILDGVRIILHWMYSGTIEEEWKRIERENIT